MDIVVDWLISLFHAILNIAANINTGGIVATLILVLVYYLWTSVNESLSWESENNEFRSPSGTNTYIPKDPSFPVSVFVGVWSMTMRKSPPAKLEKWLLPHGKKADVYIIGVENCKYESKTQESTAQDSDAALEQSCENDWFTRLSQTIENAKEKNIENQEDLDASIANWKQYVSIASKSRDQHQRLLILVKRKFALQIADVESLVVNCNHHEGTTGAIAVSFRLHETSLCVIHCHLDLSLKDNPQKTLHSSSSSSFHHSFQHTSHPSAEQVLYDVLSRVSLGNKDLEIFSQFHHLICLGSTFDVQQNRSSQSGGGYHMEFITSENGFNILQFNNVASNNNNNNNNYINHHNQYDPLLCDKILYKSAPNTKIQHKAFDVIPFRDSQLPKFKLDDISNGNYNRPASYGIFEMEVTSSPSFMTFASSYQSVEISFPKISIQGSLFSFLPSKEDQLHPYIAFYLPFGDKQFPCTTIAWNKHKNVSWDSQQTPRIRQDILNPEILQFITIGVFSYHADRKDTFLGQAALPLPSVYQIGSANNNLSLPFEVDLVRGGKIADSISVHGILTVKISTDNV